MFCEECGAKLGEGVRFCPECGAPARSSAQEPPPVPQASQNTAPMPPVPPPPGGNQRGAGGRGSAPFSGSNKALFIGLGIAALVLLLAGSGFAAYKFGLFDKFRGSGEVAAETVPQEQKAGTNKQSADPIRANIVAGTGTVASQLDEYHADKVRQLIEGQWYDNNGNALVTVSGRYINDCEIQGIYDLAGGGGTAAATFRLREKGQEWDVRLSWNITRTAGDSLTVNGSQTLHKSQERGGESVAGIHLGMTPEEVQQKLGKPSRILSRENAIQLGPEKYEAGWYYQDKMIVIGFGSGSVDSIVIPKGSSTRLDQSGLNCKNSPQDFAKAYSLDRTPPWPSGKHTYTPVPIGNGEYIHLGPEMGSITLSIYAT